MRQIPILLLEPCNQCQNRCDHCAHRGMRDDDPKYQMGIEDISILINHFKNIEYTIKMVAIHGPAEPLLWKHFNNAVRIIMNSGITERIEAVTNGRLLHIIEDDVWENIFLHVSVYGYEIDDSILKNHEGKYKYLMKEEFYDIVPGTLPTKTFGSCRCAGPMYYKRRIYPYCGPPLFDACKRSNDDHLKFSIPIEQYNPDNPVNMKYHSYLPCGWCWANSDNKFQNFEHKLLGGKSESHK